MGKHGTVEGLAKAAFPQHQWDHDKFVQPRRAIFTPQTFLQRIIRSLFGEDVAIRCNVRDEFGARTPSSLEIDIFLPSLRVGFEYQVCEEIYVICQLTVMLGSPPLLPLCIWQGNSRIVSAMLLITQTYI